METKGSKVRIIFVGMILTQRKKQPPRVAQLNDVANNNKDDDNRWQTTNALLFRYLAIPKGTLPHAF